MPATMNWVMSVTWAQGNQGSLMHKAIPPGPIPQITEIVNADCNTKVSQYTVHQVAV